MNAHISNMKNATARMAANDLPKPLSARRGTWRPSIRTVADAAGVSLNTVSLALQGSKRVKPSTAAQVLAIARQQGYCPNLLARAVITGRSRMIGVLIPGHDFSYLPRMVAAIQNAALAADFGLLILSFGRAGRGPDISRLLEYFLQRQVEGMIILPPTPPLPAAVWSPLRDTRTVWVGPGGSPDFGVDAALRPEDAGRIALDHLAKKGLRRLAYAGPADDFFSQRRLEGVLAASKKRRFPHPLVWHVPDSIEGGRAAADEWLALPTARRPRGLIGFADPIAIGFLHRLLVNGIRIPQDVAVTGVDDSLLASAAAIPLSTVRAPVESIARTAVETIIQTAAITENANNRPAWEWVGRESTP